MKNFSRIISVATVLVMCLGAALTFRWIAADLYGIKDAAANICGLVAFAGLATVAFFVPMPMGAFYMAITAKIITRNTNPKNIAGIAATHFYAFVEDIVTWPASLNPDFLGSTTVDQLVTILIGDVFIMGTGKFFHPFPCTQEEGKVTSTLVGPIDSKAFENVATFGNAGSNDLLAGHIAFIANKPVIIIVKDLNGSNKVVGTQKYPARLDTAARDSGAKVADGNMFKHSFKCYSEVPCPTILSPIPLDSTEPY